jgi:hypothetical protein
MNLGEFRAQTADLPDDTVIAVDFGDAEIVETHSPLISKLPPVLEHPWLIVIDTGQPIWIDVEYDARRDAQDECQR